MEYTNTPDENNTITLNNCVDMTYDKIFKAVCILGLQDYYEKQDVINDERDVLLLLSDKDAYFLRLLEERTYKKCLEQIKSNVAYKMDTEPDFLIREVNLSNNDSSNIITPQEIYFQISFFIKLELEIRNYYNKNKNNIDFGHNLDFRYLSQSTGDLLEFLSTIISILEINKNNTYGYVDVDDTHEESSIIFPILDYKFNDQYTYAEEQFTTFKLFVEAYTYNIKDGRNTACLSDYFYSAADDQFLDMADYVKEILESYKKYKFLNETDDFSRSRKSDDKKGEE